MGLISVYSIRRRVHLRKLRVCCPLNMSHDESTFAKLFWFGLAGALTITTGGCKSVKPSALNNGTSSGNSTGNYTIPIPVPTTPSQPASSSSSSIKPHSDRKKLSTGAYAGIGVAAGIVGALALGFGIFWLVRRRRDKIGTELGGEETKGMAELGDEKRDLSELPAERGVVEAPSSVPPVPIELDSRPVGLPDSGEVPRRTEDI